jgi:hypothetical protein
MAQEIAAYTTENKVSLTQRMTLGTVELGSYATGMVVMGDGMFEFTDGSPAGLIKAASGGILMAISHSRFLTRTE